MQRAACLGGKRKFAAGRILKCHSFNVAVCNAVARFSYFHAAARWLAASIKKIELQLVQKPTKREMLYGFTSPAFQSFPYEQSRGFRFS